MADTVKVGCRIPSGLRLRVSDWVKGPDGDMILKEVAMYDLAGSGAHIAQPGSMDAEGDATYTEIPADHFEKWMEMNKDSDLVTSGAVFKGRSNAKVASAAPADPVQDEADRQTAAREAAEKANGGKTDDGKPATAAVPAASPSTSGKDDTAAAKPAIKDPKAS